MEEWLDLNPQNQSNFIIHLMPTGSWHQSGPVLIFNVESHHLSGTSAQFYSVWTEWAQDFDVAWNSDFLRSCYYSHTHHIRHLSFYLLIVSASIEAAPSWIKLMQGRRCNYLQKTHGSLALNHKIQVGKCPVLCGHDDQARQNFVAAMWNQN